MKRDITHSTARIFATILFVTVLTSTAFAAPVVDGVSYDPAFISAGDRVEISVNMHERNTVNKFWDSDRHLKATLKPGNRLTREYVTIEKSRDESIGFLYPEGTWNQNFRVKVDGDAPTGDYGFELHMQYLENGGPVTMNSGGDVKVVRKFTMPVDRDGVELTAVTQKTDPRTPRPGDDYVSTTVNLVNTGSKPVEEITLSPQTPEGIEKAYSRNDRYFLGKLGEGGSTSFEIGLDLDEDLDPGRYDLDLQAEFEDTESNEYSNSLQVPVRVEGRPDLELEGETEMKAGSSGKLELDVRNTGSQDAESVTARAIVERTQPFSLEDRSDYVGEIEPGETSKAVLDLSADQDASLKDHNVKIQLRATGDSEEGDHSTYSFTEKTSVEVTGRKTSPLIYAGVSAAILVLVMMFLRLTGRVPESLERRCPFS